MSTVDFEELVKSRFPDMEWEEGADKEMNHYPHLVHYLEGELYSVPEPIVLEAKKIGPMVEVNIVDHGDRAFLYASEEKAKSHAVEYKDQVVRMIKEAMEEWE